MRSGLSKKPLLLRNSQYGFACIDRHTRAQLLQRGAPASRIVDVEPILDPGRLQWSARSRMRMQLGVADEGTLLVAALGGSPATVDALFATLSTSLAHDTGRDIRICISPRASGVGRTQRVLQTMQRDVTAHFTDLADRPWQMLSACDTALAIRWAMPSAWAIAAGLSVVAVSPPCLHMHSDHSSIHQCRSSKPGQVANVLRELFDAKASMQGGRDRVMDRNPSDVTGWLDACERLLAGLSFAPAPRPESPRQAASA